MPPDLLYVYKGGGYFYGEEGEGAGMGRVRGGEGKGGDKGRKGKDRDGEEGKLQKWKGVEGIGGRREGMAGGGICPTNIKLYSVQCGLGRRFHISFLILFLSTERATLPRRRQTVPR